MLLQNFTKLRKNEIMHNAFSRSLIIWEPAIETWAQEMNGGGRELTGGELKSSHTLEIILYPWAFRNWPNETPRYEHHICTIITQRTIYYRRPAPTVTTCPFQQMHIFKKHSTASALVRSQQASTGRSLSVCVFCSLCKLTGS